MGTCDEKGPAHKKPINKATMDEPQEEFIAPYASTIEPDGDYGSEPEHVSQADR